MKTGILSAKIIFLLGLAALAGCCNCLQRESGAARPYPPEWRAPVPAEQKAWWEILPQEAGPGEVILSKRTELGILSNFAPTPFVYEGAWYASVEGFWQMMKYPEGPGDERAQFPGLIWKYHRDSVAHMTSFQAKEAGDLAEKNMKAMGITWVTYKNKRMEYRQAQPGEHYRLIFAAMEQKLAQNENVRRILLATRGLVLKPDHKQSPDDPPEWRYYEIWMQLREKLAGR